MELKSTRSLAFAFIASLTLAFLLSVPLPARAADTFQLTIFHFNDTHSHLEGTPLTLQLGGEKTYVQAGGFARLAALLRSRPKEAGTCCACTPATPFRARSISPNTKARPTRTC